VDVKERGLQIKVDLMQQGRTQRWLLSKLQKRGFPQLSEVMLSHILSGRYPYLLGRNVLSEAVEIIDEDRRDRAAI
jgi:uncharacterized membrane protein YcaP (DUF421 family)